MVCQTGPELGSCHRRVGYCRLPTCPSRIHCDLLNIFYCSFSLAITLCISGWRYSVLKSPFFGEIFKSPFTLTVSHHQKLLPRVSQINKMFSSFSWSWLGPCHSSVDHVPQWRRRNLFPLRLRRSMPSFSQGLVGIGSCSSGSLESTERCARHWWQHFPTSSISRSMPGQYMESRAQWQILWMSWCPSCRITIIISSSFGDKGITV